MATDWSAVDYDDPCALLALLRPILYSRIGGAGQVTETQHGDTRTRYAEGLSVRELAAEVRRLESLCKAQTTGKSNRSVTIAG